MNVIRILDRKVAEVSIEKMRENIVKKACFTMENSPS